MAKTRAQKAEALKEAETLAKESKFLIFTDFTGVPTKDLNAFRRTVRNEAEGKYTVVKKRLLTLMLKSLGVPHDVKKEYGAQVGTIFSKSDISNAAGIAYRFGKGKDTFKLLGGLDVAGKKVISGEEVIAIGKLPPRPILLGQLLGAITGPVRKLMYVLQERSKKVATT
ncbi:MAG: 50S ribosomal protein L10 [Candidatus Colwellbacteria bacterium]|nr:50S ribosomal protein L10 [Candidatus Colwellbacteria bacterium]